jgi:uncharacterized coiled-coil protein SlyX
VTDHHHHHDHGVTAFAICEDCGQVTEMHDEAMEERLSVLAGKQQVQDDLIEAVSGDFNAEQALLAALEEEIREDLNDLWASERV